MGRNIKPVDFADSGDIAKIAETEIETDAQSEPGLRGAPKSCYKARDARFFCGVARCPGVCSSPNQ